MAAAGSFDVLTGDKGYRRAPQTNKIPEALGMARLGVQRDRPRDELRNDGGERIADGDLLCAPLWLGDAEA